MLSKADIDACLIATSHFEHVGITLDSFFEKGVHVLCEKPITVHVNGAKKMIAHGTEGLNPVMLANAIMLSSFEGRGVKLPMDGDAYEKKLEELIAASSK